MSQGAVTLAEGFAENTSLLRIELRQNNLGVAGLMALSMALKLNTSIFKVMVDVPEQFVSLVLSSSLQRMEIYCFDAASLFICRLYLHT